MKRKSAKGNSDKPLEKRGGFENSQIKSTWNKSKFTSFQSTNKISF